MPSDTMDVLIVGNGILAVALAEEIRRRDPGSSVTIMGPEARPGAASSAAGAMLGCFGEVGAGTLDAPEGRAKFQLSLQARDLWPARLAELTDIAKGAGTTLHMVDSTHVVLNAKSGPLDTANFTAMLAALEHHGEPWQEVDPRDIDGLAPRPAGRPLRAVHLPREGAVDAAQLLRIALAHAQSSGAKIRTDTVAGIERVGDRVRGVRLTSGERLQAAHVVVAAGAWTAGLLATALPENAMMPMLAGSGIAFVGSRVHGEGFRTVVRTPNRSGACGLHLVPLGDGREYVGATNVLFGEPECMPYLGVGHFLAECAMDQFDQSLFFHRIESWRMGNRPVALDGFPLIGRTEVDGLHVLSGTYRDGLHCSPRLAELMASAILDGDEGDALSLFAPTRKPIRARTVEESVREFVLHMISGWAEASAELPRHITDENLAELYDAQVRTFYERFEIGYGLGPDVLMYLLGSRKDPAEVDTLTAYLRKLG